MNPKTVEQLREDSSRMRTLGTSGAALSVAGATFAGFVSVPLAAVVGLAGTGIAVAALFRKLSDDRALADQLRATQTEPMPINVPPSGVAH